MKFLKWLLIVIGGLLALFFVVTYFLPKDYYVERSVEISTPAVMIYKEVTDLEAWQTWNPWNKLDPDITISFGDVIIGAGASYSWISEVAGNGTMVITETEAPKVVRYQLIFEGYENDPSFSSMYLNGQDPLGPTEVTWTFEGNVGDKFFARWMALLMDKFVGASYEQGLQSLKERCEGTAAQ